jgi:hypothetical protein
MTDDVIFEAPFGKEPWGGAAKRSYRKAQV